MMSRYSCESMSRMCIGGRHEITVDTIAVRRDNYLDLYCEQSGKLDLMLPDLSVTKDLNEIGIQLVSSAGQHSRSVQMQVKNH